MSSSVSGDADRVGAADDRGDVRRSLLAVEAGEVGGQRVVGLARDVALEAADDLGLGLAFGCSALGVGARAGAVARAADGDQVQRAVGVAVAAVVETVAGGLARGRRDRTGAAERGERALTAQALDVLPGADEQLSGVAGRDAEQRGRARRGAADQPLELLVERGDLLVERLDTPRQRAQREARGLRGALELARGWPQPPAEARLAADRLGLGELLAQRLGSRHDQVP